MYSLYFDGCSKGNPGKAGAGFVIYKDDVEIMSGNKYLGKQTNNVAEYSGLIMGLQQAVDLGISELNVYGDSMLVIKQMQGKYKVNSPSIKPYYEKAKTFPIKSEFFHIYREKNSRADELANQAL
jgi:ribonuclease HI